MLDKTGVWVWNCSLVNSSVAEENICAESRLCECSLLRTVLAIAGEDFSIVASDTRLSEGYAIHCRDSPKCYKL